MKLRTLQRNEQVRKDYKKFLTIMPWGSAVEETAKRYKLKYFTAEAIIFHKGRYGKRYAQHQAQT